VSLSFRSAPKIGVALMPGKEGGEKHTRKDNDTGVARGTKKTGSLAQVEPAEKKKKRRYSLQRKRKPLRCRSQKRESKHRKEEEKTTFKSRRP